MSIPKRHRLAAAGLWAIAGSWCGQQLTDGKVPDYMLKEWGATPATIKALVDSGLWHEIGGTFEFHKWDEYQPSKQDVSAEREAKRERMRNLRAKRKEQKSQDSGEKEGLLPSTTPHSAENVRNPDPTRPDPIAKAIEEEATQAPPKPSKRGHRIPEDWLPDRELVQKLQQECPGVDQQLEHRKFMDYWKAQPGAKGLKLDWEATWRNWVRRAAERAPQQQYMSGADRRLFKGYDITQQLAAKPKLEDPFDNYETPKEITP